jgi:hypothetical protein
MYDDFRNFYLLVLFVCLNVSGQEIKRDSLVKRNTLFLDVGGQSVYASVSYDRLLRVNKKINRSFSCGLALLPYKGYFFLSIPTSYNFLFGKNNHHFEVGAGITVMSESYGRRSDNLIFLSPKASYRYQRPNGGLFFKFSFVSSILGVINYSFRSTDLFYNSIFYNPDNIRSYLWFEPGIGWTF